MSVISYFGGKSSNSFINFINSKIPKTGIKTYIEPFSGSMGTYLDDESLKFDTVIYNDKNKHQTNLYYCCRDTEKMLSFINNLKSTILKTDEKDPIKKWDFYKSIYKEYQKNDFLDNTNFEIGDYEKAAIYAFLITSSHNSVYPRGAGFNGYDKKGDKLKLETLINKLRSNKYTDRLESISKFLTEDFESIIYEYDSTDTYLYLDPPYFRPNLKGEDDSKRLFWYGSEDENVFGPKSHKRLLDILKNTKCRWSLSYYYFSMLEEILPKNKFFWYEKEVFRPSAYGGNNNHLKKEQSKGKEILILNYDPITGKKIN